MYISTYVDPLYSLKSAASLQKMIYRLPSHACHRRRLESSLVLPSILWMGTGVSCLQINRRMPAWNWLLKCHICHKANQKVITQDTGGECHFVLFWLRVKRSMRIFIHQSLHASVRCLLLYESFALSTCWFKQHSASHSMNCIYSHPGALQYN